MKEKKKKATSPTKLTLAKLRKLGSACQVVEQYVMIPGKGGFRRDLFNCIDIIALSGNDTVGIQCTSRDNHGSRVTKSKGIPEMIEWLKSPMRKFLVISTRKNENKNRWMFRGSELYLEESEIKSRPFYLAK